MPWALKRKAIILGGGLALALGALALLYFSVFRAPPSCNDGRQNGDESGVDCGGSCERICPAEAASPAILWSRSFQVAPGVWTAAAVVENRNAEAGMRAISYRFTLLDRDGVSVTERAGSTFLAPRAAAVIVEPTISVGERLPARTQFVFLSSPNWERVEEREVPRLLVRESALDEEGSPRASALIVNDSPSDVRDVEAAAIVLNTEGNAIAVSRAVIPRLARGQSERVVFTWPAPFPEAVARLDVRVRAPFLAP